jgi:adenosine deaminase
VVHDTHRQLWKLSESDMAELAMNSVMISGFSHQEKLCMLGEAYHTGEPEKMGMLCR